MATVNKDFRIKAGLVVEGTNATVNGEDIITTGSSTDVLPEGTSNLYYTESRAKTDAAELLTGATLTNITITGDGSGLTITAENGGITDISGFDTDDLTEGSTNLYFTDSRAVDAVETAATSVNTASKIVLRDASGNFAAGQITANEIVVQTAGTIFEDSALNITSTTGNDINISANQDVNITSQNGDIVLNPDGDLYKGSVASQNEIITQSRLDQYIGDNTVNGSTGNTIADRISTAETNANSYTDTELGNYTQTSDLDETIDGYGYIKSTALSGYATESYVTTAVDNLVDGAPGLLDTLNEIAAAIADDENYATTMTTALSNKQNTLSAGTNISIVSDTISVTGLSSTDISDFNTAALSATSSAYDAAGAASSAQSAAESYTDTAINGLDTDAIEEGSNLYFTDERAIDAVSAADIYPNAVIVNNVSKTVANTQSVSTASTVSGITWAKADYKSAKLVVKAATATHSQVSEIMVTLDSSDNVAITEFGIVYTDTELATVTADVSGTDVRVRVTTLNASTTVTVVGTLLI